MYTRLFFSVLIGILLSNFIYINFYGYYLDISFWLIFLDLMVILLLIYLKRLKYIILPIFFGVSYFIMSYTYLPSTPMDIEYYIDQSVDVYGYVCDDIDIRENYINIEVCVEGIGLLDQVLPVDGKLLLKDYIGLNFSYGDRIKLISPELMVPFESLDFSYRKYLLLNNITNIVYIKDEDVDKVELLDGFRGNNIFKWIIDIKHSIAHNVDIIFDKPYSGLILGLILGYRGGIDEELLHSFNNTGLTHLLAVSGANISLIAAIIFTIFGRISRFIAIPILILVILFFIFLTGAEASVVRAGIMGILAFTAMLFGRSTLAKNSLFMVSVLMMLYNPLIVLYDVGAQLSFLATLGIIYLYPLLDFIVSKINVPKMFNWFKFLQLKEVFLLSISATVFVLPIILSNFHQISILSPLVNVLVGWTIPYIMIIGSLVIIFSYISIYISIVLSYLIKPLIWWLYNIAIYVDTYINILFKIDYLPLWMGVVYFILIFWVIQKPLGTFELGHSMNYNGVYETRNYISSTFIRRKNRDIYFK